uniref:Putative chitobiosyldiphosphodolichol beta-mannosyltransferase n=1 Tax=Ixodes ricinus TaxID=34613 RepID=A0A131XS77_IXORI
MSGARARRVCVLVLGDFGHSPRMNYHSLSLAKSGFKVDVVAYGGSHPSLEVLSNENIELHLMKDPPNFQRYVPRLLAYVFKTLWQSVVLLACLFWLSKPSHLLVQNPPSIPTLPVAWLYCLLRGCALVVDWHNYGYSILALALKETHPLVRVCRFCEKTFGRKAGSAFCVSEAMREDLRSNWGVRAQVLYDKPAAVFRPTDPTELHPLFQRLAREFPELRSSLSEKQGRGDSKPDDDYSRTVFTQEGGSGSGSLRPDRPALLVSGTSWTEDEDFSVLLESLEAYDAKKERGDSSLPNLFCVITGKGPMKDHYLAKIRAKPMKHVQFLAPWLSAQDYPKLLGAADLGVCLHTSSSKLDLPMKVVDMFGCGLPVCAVDYPCIQELVKPGETGLVFQSSEELCDQLCDLLKGFPEMTERLKSMRENVHRWQTVRWDDNWTRVALPTFASE